MFFIIRLTVYKFIKPYHVAYPTDLMRVCILKTICLIIYLNDLIVIRHLSFDWFDMKWTWRNCALVLLYLKSVILFFVSFYDATFLCNNVTWDLQKKPKGLNCFRRRQNAFPLAVTYITSTLIFRSLAVLLVFPEIINWIFFN